jgi:REP element-mobilizing transposase RayT
MKFDPSIHHRRSIRLKGYDYSQSGVYFITLVAQDRLNLFGEITDGVMCLSRIGEITRSAWLRLADLFPIRHDEWVIMPNHLHAIIWILDLGRGEASASKDFLDPWRSLTQRQAIGTRSGSLGAIIQNFKSISRRKINQGRGNALADITHAASSRSKAEASTKHAERIWQRNYYEHIIRNQPELDRIRQYIADNPHQWEEDQENPERSG